MTALGHCRERSATWWAKYLAELNEATVRALFGRNTAMAYIAVATSVFISFWWRP